MQSSSKCSSDEMDSDIPKPDLDFPSSASSSLVFSSPSRTVSGVESVLQTSSSKKGEQTEKNMRRWFGIHTTHFCQDLIFDILRFLPVKPLLRFRCVCKAWLKLIDNLVFINAQREVAQHCSNKTTLIFMRHLDKKPPTWGHDHESAPSVNSILDESAPIYCHLYCLEFENGKAKVELLHKISSPCCMLSACNGLVLLNMDAQNCLVVMNPITRKLISLPRGTMPSRKVISVYLNSEKYVLTFVPSTSDYKLVHLFRDTIGHIRCETLNFGTRSWKAVVDWPTFSMHNPNGAIASSVEAFGYVHWQKLRSKHTMVSFGIEDDKFYETELPNSDQYEYSFPLREFEESLCCFLASYRLVHMDIWMLKSLSGIGWIKHYTIESPQGRVSFFGGNIICFLRETKELVFAKESAEGVEAYDFQLGVMRKVEVQGDLAQLNVNTYGPFIGSFKINKYEHHTDSLAMWKM